jgi:ribosome biogenesis GTPase
MPETTTIFIDRFLVTAEAYGVPVYLLFNKIDLYEDDSDNLDYLNGLINLYSTIGYKCLKLSVFNKEGLDEIKKLTVNQITLLAGHSGVGKSSLINELHNEADRRVGDISSYHHKGMHTTTFSEMIELDNGGYLIDTPGIKGFGTIDMTTAEVSHYFPEIFKFSTKCKYNNCLHINEPDCAVLKAIDDHYISQSRYASYLSVLDDVDEVKYR